MAGIFVNAEQGTPTYPRTRLHVGVRTLRINKNVRHPRSFVIKRPFSVFR
jgi:hypothetical protein